MRRGGRPATGRLRVRDVKIGDAILAGEVVRAHVARYLVRLPHLRESLGTAANLWDSGPPVTLQEETWLRAYAAGRTLAQLGDGSRIVERAVYHTIRRAVATMVLRDRIERPPPELPPVLLLTQGPPPVLG